MRICYIMNKIYTLVWSAPPTLMLYRMGEASHIHHNKFATGNVSFLHKSKSIDLYPREHIRVIIINVVKSINMFL